MTALLRLRRCRWMVLAAGLALAGCSATAENGAESNPLAWLNGQNQEPPQQQQVAAGPSFTVELRRNGYKPETVRVPFRGTMHLQDALEQTGALSKVSQMELYILRTPPQGGPQQRMTAVYDSGEGRVSWESDYALYPGDHVVVIEDTSTPFDKYIDRFLGPTRGKK